MKTHSDRTGHSILRRSRGKTWLSVAVVTALTVGCASSREPRPTEVPTGSFSDSPAVPATEDGYDLWLRYRVLDDATRLQEARAALKELVASEVSPTLQAAHKELRRGLSGLLGVPFNAPLSPTISKPGGILVGTVNGTKSVAQSAIGPRVSELQPDGYIVEWQEIEGHQTLVVAGNTELGALYGSFALLRHLQQHKPLAGLSLQDAPRVQHRVLNHWDNLDRTVERGYAGQSLWEWDQLPASISPRYEDYARANASLGINGAALTNVNANAQVLTAPYLEKVKAIAGVLRPYGVKVFLTARFSAPIEIGGLKTADPLDPAVVKWWADKVSEIYGLIPDFGGLLVKANSEGQPGPQDYQRSHVEGANMLADAVAPHGGVVMWRAFVYSDEVPSDRIRQAYDEFQPLDGKFRKNVFVQPKNGPLDFQPREPFHPLLGAMPNTPLALELQVTKEYLGQDTHLAYLGPWYEEVLQADTFAEGKGSTVAEVVDGTLHAYPTTAIAGVANIGTDRNWTGSQFNQANWYVYGRMAWDPQFAARDAAEEWTRLTFTNDDAAVETITELMMQSHQTLVDYMTPMGLVHIMAAGHHYGPGPWVDFLGRPDWNSVYYHRADESGLGFDRTQSGSKATEQYFPPVRDAFENRQTVSEDFLLFFHHVGWGEKMKSGRTLWHELVHRYSRGVTAARKQRESWDQVKATVDSRRHAEVAEYLKIQADEAQWWRDASLQYFSQFSKQPIPAEYEPALHPLKFYLDLKPECPVDRTRPRCAPVYQ